MSYTLISTQTLNSNVTTVTFSSIPQTYTDLVLVTSARSTLAASVGSSTYMSLNGSSANFAHRRFYGNGSAAYANVDGVSSAYSNDINGQGTNTYNFSNSKLTFYNYTSANYKPYTIDTAVENSNSTAAYTMLTSGIWSNTAAITSISFASEGSSSFQIGSTFSLYGVSRITTATLGATPTVEYLVVAGGGGGGSGHGGGGGAGGYRTNAGTSGANSSPESQFSVSAGTSYTVTVGAGGAGGSSNANGAAGSNSVFSTITSVGGGYGAGYVKIGGNGGSGGGTSGRTDAGGAGTSAQGFAGGAGGTDNTSYGAGGGGGGAGAVGGNGYGTGTSAGVGGAGGSGISSTITGFATIRAGGGGGGSNTSAAGGAGGGGAGANSSGAAGSAMMTTGSGGGGNNQSAGGAGGSGVVTIRYPDTYANPTAVTGNPVVNYANGYKIYTWTASGSITF